MRTRFGKILAMILMMSILSAFPANAASAAVKSFKLSRTSVTVTVNKTVQLKAVVNGKTAKAAWSSGNKNIATVSSTGVVRAKKPGKVTITARIGGVKRTCKVTVNTALYNTVMKWVRGKWYGNSSRYMDEYFCFKNGYICEYKTKTNKLVYRTKIKAIKKYNSKYAITTDRGYRYVFVLSGGKVRDLWYYWYSQGQWNYSGSSSLQNYEAWR